MDGNESAGSVSTNAAPGELVDTLSMVVTNPADFAFSVVASGPDYTYFDIATGTTNLRTTTWIDSDAYTIMILATNSGDGAWVTKFTITASAVAVDPIFAVGAEVEFPVADGDIVGVMTTVTAGVTFSFVGGNDDLFTQDANNNLIVTNFADWGGLDTTSYVTLRATGGSGSTDMVVGVTVVSGVPAGTIFLFQ